MNNIFELGKKSYYEGIPRYKNPYCDSMGEMWINGWDSACKEHELFTENQHLKLGNKKLMKEMVEFKSRYSQQSSDIDSILDTLLKHLDKGILFFSRGDIKTGIFQIKDILSKS